MAALDPQSGSDNGSPKGGSPHAAAALETHRRWLRSVVFARVGDFDAADEVMQEVALAAVRGRLPLTEPEGLSAWLYRVAVRQSLLYRRRKGRHGGKVEGYRKHRHGDVGQTLEGDPLRWLLADEEMALVRRAMNALSHKDRELLLLKYTEDWSCRELAERLGVSITTIETRLHRARGRLRKELTRLDVIEEKP